MAGRPKRKAKQVAALLEAVDVTAARTYFARPDPETLRHDQPDALDKAWEDAVRTTMDATIALERLAVVLAEKAKLPAPASAFTLADNPAISLERLTKLATSARLAPPTLNEVQGMHRRKEEEEKARQEEEELWDGADEDEVDGWEDDEEDAQAEAIA